MSCPQATLLLGDALDCLERLESGSVGHIVTDPPYGQSNERYDKGVDPRVWRECHRVTGPNAALIAFAGSPTYHRLATAIEDAGWKVRQMWAWVYRDGLITSAYPREGFDRLAPAFDPIVFATKGKVLLNLEREGQPWSIKTPRSKASPLSQRSGVISRTQAPGRYPRTIVSDGIVPFEYFMGSRTASRRGYRTDHPNQKPLALMEWLIAKLPETGPVLDLFAGSGTTGDACQNTGRDFIGIEIDPAYHAIALRRLATAQAVEVA